MPSVSVLFFAGYREIAGTRSESLDVAEGISLGELVDRVVGDRPGLEPHRDTMLLAVNQEFSDTGRVLREGDEVALLPPVSGGDSDFVRLQTERIDVGALVETVRSVRAGAVVLFLGTVRADPGVEALDYEAYAGMAEKQMREIRERASERFGLMEMALVHRTGLLPLGEESVAIACSAPHRKEAFEACAWAMEELKKVVPIWKTESGG